MRGFMIGAFYFLSGIFSLFALLLVIMFVVAFQTYRYYDCGLGYYSTSMLIGIGALILYTFVAYRYKRKSRQHIGNEQQMIEECYEHIPCNWLVVTTKKMNLWISVSEAKPHILTLTEFNLLINDTP